jgi:hypothetical protein
MRACRSSYSRQSAVPRNVAESRVSLLPQKLQKLPADFFVTLTAEMVPIHRRYNCCWVSQSHKKAPYPAKTGARCIVSIGINFLTPKHASYRNYRIHRRAQAFYSVWGRAAPIVE